MVIPLNEKQPVPFIPDNAGQRVPADLILMAVWLAAAIGVIYFMVPALTPLRAALTLPLLLFIPGYCVVAALFPKNGDLNGIERFVLSFGLSIAVVPLIGLILNFTPWGIRLEPIILSISSFTLVMILIAWYMRAVLPPEERFRISLRIFAESFREGDAPVKKKIFDRLYGAILLLAILITLMTAIYVISVPREGEPFTEFFILGNNRTADSYPNHIVLGQNYPMYVGVENHEYRDTRYMIETWMMHTEFDNATNSTRILSMNPDNRVLLTLANNQTSIIPYNFSVSSAEYNRVEFLLFDENVPGLEVTGSDRINASYRNLHLKFTDREE